MKHCCVIGGTGFIGSHLVKMLSSQKRKVSVIGRSSSFPRSFPRSVSYFSGDYRKKNFLKKSLTGADEVIHLAYSSVPETSIKNPIQDILNNVPAAVQLFDIASSLKIKKIVIVSSGGTVYGKAQKLPIKENHPTNPICPYGITKLAVEKYAMMFKKLKGLPVVCVRPANAYGVGQKPFTGQGFIATAIASILKKKQIKIFGSIGTIRDYIYVSDIAKGIISALKHGKPGLYYNIGSGIGYSNKDVLKIIKPLAKSEGLKVRVKILPVRPFDVPSNILDSSKLMKETGWKKTISLKKGIEKTWKSLCIK